MKRIVLLALILSLLSACLAQKPLQIFEDPDRIWKLQQLNGTPFSAPATLSFQKPDQIAGKAPCNRYFGTMTATYPAFKVGPINSTRVACANLRFETAYLRALEAATTARAIDNTLILTNADGLEMVFKSTD
jgi:heat shock protein HslJ